MGTRSLKNYHNQAMAPDWTLGCLAKCCSDHPLFNFKTGKGRGKKKGGGSKSPASGGDGGGDKLEKNAVHAAMKRLADTATNDESRDLLRAGCTAIGIEQPDF